MSDSAAAEEEAERELELLEAGLVKKRSEYQFVLAGYVVTCCRLMLRFQHNYFVVAERFAECDKSERYKYARLKREKLDLWMKLANSRQELRRSIVQYSISCCRNWNDRLIDVREVFGVTTSSLLALFDPSSESIQRAPFHTVRPFLGPTKLSLICTSDEEDHEAIERGELKIGVFWSSPQCGHWFALTRNHLGRETVSKRSFSGSYAFEIPELVPKFVRNYPTTRFQLPFQLTGLAHELLDPRGRRYHAVFKGDLNIGMKVPVFHIKKVLDTEAFRMVFFNKTSDAYGFFPDDLLKFIYEFVLH